MSENYTVTDDVADCVEWCENKGIYSWDQPYGITVSSDVRACFEGLMACLAGGTVTVTRDQNQRVTNLAFSNYSTTDYDAGVNKMEAAIDSHDKEEIGSGDGYTP